MFFGFLVVLVIDIVYWLVNFDESVVYVVGIVGNVFFRMCMCWLIDDCQLEIVYSGFLLCICLFLLLDVGFENY